MYNKFNNYFAWAQVIDPFWKRCNFALFCFYNLEIVQQVSGLSRTVRGAIS